MTPAVALPRRARMYSLTTAEPRRYYEWLAGIGFDDQFRLVVVSRLPGRRLARVMGDLSHEHLWLTERGGEGALAPVLERIHYELERRIGVDEGVIWLDAVEYLVTSNGFDSVLTFLRSVGDAVSQSRWRVIAPLAPDAFDEQELAQLQRELAPWHPQDFSLERPSEPRAARPAAPTPAAPVVATADDVFEAPAPAPVAPAAPSSVRRQGSAAIDAPVLVEPGLVHLSTIPERLVNIHALRERILAWRRMGIDTSDVEPALHYPISEMRLAYQAFEQQVARAVELDRMVDRIEALGYKGETVKSRFRVRQLTGLDEVERELLTLLEQESGETVEPVEAPAV